MMYINVATGAYPITHADICREHPDVSFPAELNDGALVAFGYARVAEAETQPAHDDTTQKLIEATPVRVNKTTYQRRYEVVSLTPAEKTEIFNRVLNDKKQMLEAAFVAIRDGGVEVNGYRYQTSRDGRADYTQFNQIVALNQSYTSPWQTVYGRWVTMTPALLLTIVSVVAAHTTTCYEWVKTQGESIAACKTATELRDLHFDEFVRVDV